MYIENGYPGVKIAGPENLEGCEIDLSESQRNLVQEVDNDNVVEVPL